ncbi:MAG: hypothetical protein VW771_04810, partial [Gammaproteobacteria bacterium]
MMKKQAFNASFILALFFALVVAADAKAQEDTYQVVPFNLGEVIPSTRDQPVFIDGGVVLQGGRIRELPTRTEPPAIRFYFSPYEPSSGCRSNRSVTIRKEASRESRKVGRVNLENHQQYRFVDDGRDTAWLRVFDKGESAQVGWVAKALKYKSGYVENLFCFDPRPWVTTSEATIGGKAFKAELRSAHRLSILGNQGVELVSHVFKGFGLYVGHTSLYELRSGGEFFGWLAGWNKDCRAGEEGCPQDPDVRENSNKSYVRRHFSVARVFVPYIDVAGEQKVADFLLERGFDQHEWAGLIPPDTDPKSFTFIAFGNVYPPFGSMAEVAYWAVPNPRKIIKQGDGSPPRIEQIFLSPAVHTRKDATLRAFVGSVLDGDQEAAQFYWDREIRERVSNFSGSRGYAGLSIVEVGRRLQGANDYPEAIRALWGDGDYSAGAKAFRAYQYGCVNEYSSDNIRYWLTDKLNLPMSVEVIEEFISSLNGEKREGLVSIHFENGHLARRGEFRKGQREGPWVYY